MLVIDTAADIVPVLLLVSVRERDEDGVAAAERVKVTLLVVDLVTEALAVRDWHAVSEAADVVVRVPVGVLFNVREAVSVGDSEVVSLSTHAAVIFCDVSDCSMR